MSIWVQVPSPAQFHKGKTERKEVKEEMGGAIITVKISYLLNPAIQIGNELASIVSYDVTTCACGCTKTANASFGDEDGKILGIYDVGEEALSQEDVNQDFLFVADYIPPIIKQLFITATYSALNAIDNCQNGLDPMENISNIIEIHRN